MPLVNLFEEYLAEWEFSPEWRPFAERLAVRALDWPLPDVPPDEFAVWPAQDRYCRPTSGLLVWADIPMQPKGNSLTLGVQIDPSALRCGCLSSHNVAAGFIDWVSLDHRGKTLADLADDALEWFAQALGPVERERWRTPWRQDAMPR
jgi:hypothetical protein